MRIYNLDALVKVVVTKKLLTIEYVWQDYRKKTFWKKEIKEGFVRRGWISCMDKTAYTKEQLESQELIVEGEKVYDMPTVYLYFNNSSDYQYYEKFKTNAEAADRARSIVLTMRNLLPTN